MKKIFVAIIIILIALFQSSFLSEFAIFGNTINIIFAIAMAVALLKWDDAAPLWVGLGGLILDLINTTPFGFYILTFGASYFIIRIVSARIAFALDQKYLVFVWSALSGLLYFVIGFGYLYFFGSVGNLKSYLLNLLIVLIIYSIIIPISYFFAEKILDRQKNTSKIIL